MRKRSRDMQLIVTNLYFGRNGNDMAIDSRAST